ncbi:chemotaxis protein CheW [Myxococcota bacterium]
MRWSGEDRLVMSGGKKGAGPVGHDENGASGTWEAALRSVVEDGTTEDPLADFFVSVEEAAANQAMGVGEVFSGSVRHAEEMIELLAFWVADEEYAINIVQIQEIIKVPSITVVPRAPTCVLGVISLRGTIVPVSDLRAILGMERASTARASRILVLRDNNGEPAGLLVDEVSSVVRFDREAIQPVPRTIQPDASDLLQGVGRDGERMLIVLDLASVLAATEYVP